MSRLRAKCKACAHKEFAVKYRCAVPSWGKARTGCEGFRFSQMFAVSNAATSDVYGSCRLSRWHMSLTPHSNGDSESFGIVSRDPKLQRIIETIRTAAPSDASILIEGESGTGKHLIANAIQAHSRRCARPFVHANWAATPPELIEPKLFGYGRGVSNCVGCDERGLIEAANGGTLLLDEIGDMPAHLQTRLFRVLQHHKLVRVGDELEIDVNFRLIVTTSRNTSVLLEAGVLNKDLYFCISTIKIKVPPLRERLDDVPLLVEHFLARLNTKYNRRVRGIAQETLFCLQRYYWPGNVRELESVIERAFLFCPGNLLLPEYLPEELHANELHNVPFVIPPLVPIEVLEREAIVQTLARTSGNVKQSAEILHYPRPTFYRKLKKFGIKVDRQ